MQIAANLEKRGIKNIIVYLLDTILSDDNSSAVTDLTLPFTEEEIFDFDYIRDLTLADQKMAMQSLSCNLNHTQIVLLQAMLNPDDSLREQTELQSQIDRIKHFLQKPEQLHVVKMFNSNHVNILKDEALVLNIFNYSKNDC